MTGAWRRLGRLALDASAAPWARSHAALPAPEPAGTGRWNVYLAARDADNRSRIGRAVLSLAPVPRLGPLHPEPVLDLGAPGAFDEHGVTMSCLVADAGARYLFYTGWQRGGEDDPFRLAVGLAVAEGPNPFRRVLPGPLLERTAGESQFTASPFVLRGPDCWRMWYVAGSGWRMVEGRRQPCYDIRYAESPDGFTWARRGPCVDSGADEYAFGRPWVCRDPDRYRMWFSVRGDRYRIGAAESIDGIAWTRTDETGGLLPAADGWDAGMVEYPAVIDYERRRYMLYNGNDYGRTGLGIAVWQPGPDSPAGAA